MLVTGILVGFFFASLIFMALERFYTYKNNLFVLSIQRELQKIMKEELQKAELMGSVNYRFKQINEMTKRQMDLVSQMEAPSKSAAHSRNKSALSGELKQLEEQKLEIFQSFLNDNIDPVITVLNSDGEPSSMKVSEFMGLDETKEDLPNDTDPKNHRRSILKLVEETNDEQDGNTDHTDDPTFH